MIVGARAETWRWTRFGNQRREHLWLGHETACGKRLKNLASAFPSTPCPVCAAYAAGWLDRHDYGSQPPSSRSPLGADAIVDPPTGEDA